MVERKDDWLYERFVECRFVERSDGWKYSWMIVRERQLVGCFGGLLGVCTVIRMDA